jgi:hypothetical protein
MTIFSIFFRTSAFMAVALGAANAQPATVKPSFSITISAPEIVVKAGGRVKISLALKNESGERIALVREVSLGLAESYTDLDVRDEKGRPVPESRFYAVLKGKPDPYKATGPGFAPPLVVGGSHIREWVSPGDTWKDEITVSNLLDMKQPGKYTISLSRLDPASNTVVKSNTITVTVAE